MKSKRKFTCMWPDENCISKWQLSRRNMSNVELPGPRIEHSKSQSKSRDKKNICNAIAQCSYQVLVILGWKFMETWPPFEMWKGNQNNIFHKVALLVVFLLNLLCFFVPVVIVIFVAFVVFVVLLFLLFWLFLMFLLFLMF